MCNAGQILNGYKVISLLGSAGSYGQAFKAVNLINNSEVALKECFGKEKEDLDRFIVENDILYSLYPHQYIIAPLSRVFNDGTSKCYFMEIADENLQDFLNRSYSLSVDEKIDICKKICVGVDYAHDKNIVHRDLHGCNILIINQNSGPMPKITDFGRSRDFNLVQQTKYIPNNWGYIGISQPELKLMYWDNPTLDFYIKGDVYALGIILFYNFDPKAYIYSEYLDREIERYLAMNNITISTLSEVERQKTYNDWLKTIDYVVLDKLSGVALPDQRYANKISSIIKKACHPDFLQRYPSVKDLLLELNSI